MTVPVVTLPISTKKRLEVGDLTVENDIVAAKVVDWAEDRDIPEACVIQIFGRGSDVEALIASILFDNAIAASEFYPETLFCLPHLPLELPPKELRSRRDLRNLCFNKHEIRSVKAQEALSISASKLKLPCAETLADVAHCNERKLAARHVKDATLLALKESDIIFGG